MTTVSLDTVRDGTRVKEDKSCYRGPGETEPSGKSDVKTAKRRIRMDPSRALEPSQKKLASIETQRIMNVFESTINRAKLVCMIPYIIENLEQFEPFFESGILTLFKQHKTIQDSYLEIKVKMIERHKEKQRKLMKERQAESLQGDECVSNDEDISIGERELTQSPVGSNGESNKEETSPSYRPNNDNNCPRLETGENGKDDSSPVDEEQKDDEGGEREDDPASGEELEDEEDEGDEEYKAMTEMMMKNLSVVAEQLSNSCKNIIRAFNKCPSAVTAVHKELAHMSPAAAKFIENMEEMKVILRNRLLTSPMEEKDQAEYLKEMVQKTQQNEIQIKKLEAELAEAIVVKEEETRRQNDVIRKIQEEIRLIDKQSEDNNRRVKSEAESKINAELKTSDSKCAKIQQELFHYRNTLMNLTNDHQNQELEICRRNYKAETEVENWIQKYDQEMGQLQEEFETIDEIYKSEKKQLCELEERFATLQKEYLTIIDEREMARRAREESERKMILMVKAATTIQAFWRSFKVRAIMRTKKKKGSGPGNGKKKKK